MLVQIMEIASLLSEAQFGNALEVTKYKIIYLSVPSWPKAYNKYKVYVLMEKPQKIRQE